MRVAVTTTTSSNAGRRSVTAGNSTGAAATAMLRIVKSANPSQENVAS